MQTNAPHNFHIPVMGLAYTIDTPIKVAKYGINSVISIIEDKLIELMRKYYYEQNNLPYIPITPHEDDYRAKRITDYLNLVNKIVKEQFESLKATAFETGSEISKYFQMLPGNSATRAMYERMLSTTCAVEKHELMRQLRNGMVPGQIDVNIMTKVDKNNYNKQGELLEDSSDALAALRGYARSNLANSSIVFSAGLNPRLFNYLEKLNAFEPKDWGQFSKKIIVKVSDYRSALIQGKYLAKKGIWVSEFRIESGLNCGGHAFASDGNLLGPILEEFKKKKAELVGSLHELYLKATREKQLPEFIDPHPLAITVQGGIGTFEENELLHKHYGIQSTGWGTPFLLCPEATTVDDATLELLKNARQQDIVLSKNSPLGIRFNYLKGTSAEKEKISRISQGKPGSPCTEKHLVSNTEFSAEPICTASSVYQKKKIAQLKASNPTAATYEKQFHDITRKECLCIGLSNAAIIKYDLPPVKNLKAITICPGPNIAYFHKTVSLQEMTDHIYGRTDLLKGMARPHMFIKELILNIDYLREQLADLNKNDSKKVKDLLEFSRQLLTGIEYYHSIAGSMNNPVQFQVELNELRSDIERLNKSIMAYV